MSRSFTLEDQRAFAIVSGDANPMHLDPLQARRTMFGVPVVHGIHLLLWALGDSFKRKRRLVSVNATFHAPLRIDTSVTVQDIKEGRIGVDAGGETIALIGFDSEDAKPAATDIPDRVPGPSTCREWSEVEIASAAGEFDLALPLDALEGVLPGITEKLDLDQIAVLLATTRLVGMECPGLYSIYSNLKLTFSTPDAKSPPVFSWNVRRYDGRFGIAAIDVSASGMAGTITAFVRPKPAKQVSYLELRARADLPNVSGEKALVVGGSRGLGELTAKMLAAGGAHVVLTYSKGKEDAERVVQDIVAHGGKADAMALDIKALPKNLASHLPANWRPTQMFYFATPPISVATKKKFQYDVFEAFNEFYVRAFHDIIEQIKPHLGEALSVFYPSSVFVTETPANMGEYAASKSAGEALCAFLRSTVKGLIIHVERLPRLPTDQTATIVPVATGDPVEVMSGVVRSMKDAGK